MTESLGLDDIVRSFRDTNKRLADLAEASGRLKSAEQSFEQAKVHAGDLIRSSVAENKEQLAEVVARAEASIDASQRALRDVASSLNQLIDQTKDVARELSDITDAFRKTEPEKLLAATLRNRVWIRVAVSVSSLSALLAAIALGS
jgi:3-methyladenine DNA glycosylase/8-oxoguanine DNA glycosylase